jgi:hypothetical protein
MLISIVIVLITSVRSGPELIARACGNVSAVLQARAQLAPHVTGDNRAALRREAVMWAERGLQFAPQSTSLLKRRGMLALLNNDFATATRTLEPALIATPHDQAVRKALGLALVWEGRIDEGVALLRDLDQAGEVAEELTNWPSAWRDARRPELAQRAEQAAVLMQSAIGD